MTKKASTFLNMTLTLFVITLIAGVSLGFINDITKGPKAQAKLDRKINALKNVLPEFNNNPVENVKLIKTDSAKDSVEIYTAFLNENQSGIAVVGSSDKGFSGLVKIMVGFNTDGSIFNIAVLEQKETPGLGTKMKGEKFLKQFRGKHPKTYNLKVKKDQGDVDALTGATITTRAFSEATQMAYEVFETTQLESKN
jgi:electron transport complex protein RnfG